MKLRWFVLLVFTSPVLAAEPLSYGKDIRPILAENCFYCHGQDPNHRKADVRLDTAEGQKETLVPGKPDESELVKRIFSTDAGEQMPPPKSNRKLTDDQKKKLKQWIAEGAKFEGHWAYQAPKRPPVPKVENASNPIDAFLQSKQKQAQLKTAPEADKVTLIRRVTLDLIGLPPTPEEVQAFLKDTSPQAYEKLVDRLMKSPHYGERQALPWLDAARYADSNGFQQEGDTFQWVWRDWVVKAINDNMPFDQFTIEQLAGDLLPNATLSQKIATGFNRNHLVNGEGGAIPEEQRFNILFDRVDVTATNWLGLTMACAQCHDHKYDPMTMKDYYSLQAAFNNVSESGVAGRQSSKTRVSPPFIEAPTPEQEAALAILQENATKLRQQLSAKQKEWEAKVASDEKYDKAIRELVLNKDPKAKIDRDTKLKKHFEEKVEPKLVNDLKNADNAVTQFKADEIPKPMVMADDRPRDTHILDRGEYLKKKEKVTFNTPEFLPPLPKDAPRNRLGLARWLVAPENPLMARVIVNRMWQAFFGVGLVKTAEDFGVQSDYPLHGELLDWLAVEFRESGWDMKKFNRLILTSQTYKQSSRVSAELLAKDPENRYFARFPRLRLPSLILRDVALATSGLLNKEIGGKPTYPYQPDGIWETLAITKERDFTYPASKGKDLYRRSLYTFWRRTVSPANMFDSASRQVCKVRASVTNTPLHALTTLNDVTWTEASRVLGAKLLNQDSSSDTRLTLAFKLILAREPKPQELSILNRMLKEQTAYFTANPKEADKLVKVGAAPVEPKLNSVDLAAWASICLALYNTDEALTRE